MPSDVEEELGSGRGQGNTTVSERVKRTWHYLAPPIDFEMAGCPNGIQHDTYWSEWKDHLWCYECEIDFIPEHAGIFEGPICVEAAHMLGCRFDRYDLERDVVEIWSPETGSWITPPADQSHKG